MCGQASSGMDSLRLQQEKDINKGLLFPPVAQSFETPRSLGKEAFHNSPSRFSACRRATNANKHLTRNQLVRVNISCPSGATACSTELANQSRSFSIVRISFGCRSRSADCVYAETSRRDPSKQYLFRRGITWLVFAHAVPAHCRLRPLALPQAASRPPFFLAPARQSTGVDGSCAGMGEQCKPDASVGRAYVGRQRETINGPFLLFFVRSAVR